MVAFYVDIICTSFASIKIAYLAEGWLTLKNKGEMFFFCNLVSAGHVVCMFKIRLIKAKYIEPNGAKRGSWIAYAAERTLDSLTYVGRFVKKFYINEPPQFSSILRGCMSVVGTRPLLTIYYKRDLAHKSLKGST